MTRKRLDVLLLERGLFASRELAQRAILAGLVQVDGKLADKPGQRVREEGEVVLEDARPYVSRGGDKLAGAIEAFGFSPEGLICLDLGASTGGFTDCLLRHGAERVYAVDVGRGQLDWRLRNDSRVKVMEGVNARYLEPGAIPEPPGLITADVSFISLCLILPAAVGLMPPVGEIVALIKPQFEAGRAQVGKRGVVRLPEIHHEVLARVLGKAADLGLELKGLTHSPLQGPKGNIEFFAWWHRGDGIPPDDESIESVVRAAHGCFGHVIK